MIEVVEWLLDLEAIRLARDAPLVLTWGRHPPAWILFVVGVAVVALVVLLYRRENASIGRRLVLGVLRCVTIGLVVAILCRPTLLLQRNRVEPSYVAVALDTSQSMGNRDRYLDTALADAISRGAATGDADGLEHYSRLDLVKAALTRDDAAPLARLLERNEVHLCTFAGTVEQQALAGMARESARSGTGDADPLTIAPQIGSADSLSVLTDVIDATVADGTRTDLAGAITSMLENTQGRRLAAIVLATDGQSTEQTSLTDALDLARGRKVPVLAIRIGSPERPRDVRVGPVRAEATVFLNDLLAVEARVSASGLTGPTPVRVRLLDERTGTLAASVDMTLDPTQPDATVELLTKPTVAGPGRYRVEIAPIPGEHSLDNNVEHVEVVVIDDRLRVLYVDAYPRYEYRYLKNALLREETMEVSVLLLEADEAFVQEGTYPIRRFPDTPEELSRYDVVLFGDVDPRGGWLTAAQMTMLLDFVGHEGGGFGLIAGERSAPHRFAGTPLEKLIPVRIDPEFLGHYEASLSTGFHLRLTEEGRRSRFFRRPPGLRIADPIRTTEPSVPSQSPAQREAASRGSGGGHPIESLPELYWLARTLGPKPGATVLAEHPTLQSLDDYTAGSRPMPVIVVGRYGAGRILFQATDDTWRWRRHTGEFFHDAYWVQFVRGLMRHERVAQNRSLVIHTDRKVYAYGSPVHAQVELLDMQLLAGQGDSIKLVMTEKRVREGILTPGNAPLTDRNTTRPDAGRDREGDSPTPTAHATDVPARSDESASGHAIVARFTAHRLGPGSNLFEGTVIPPRPGRYSIKPTDVVTRPAERPASASISVERPDLETRRIEADHDVLERIAEATGGRVVELDQLETEFGAIPDRSVRIPDDVAEPLWDSKLALMLFGLMISIEWVLRKAFGLL